MVFRLTLPALAAAFVCALAAPAAAERPFDFNTTPGRLPKNVVPTAYSIAITPDATAKTLRGIETVALDVRTPAARIMLNTLNMTISQARLDGAPLRVNTENAKQLTTLIPAHAVRVGHHILTLAYAGKIEDAPQGLFAQEYRKPDGTTARMLATQFESTDARRMFPSWDEPAFRATFQLTVTLPAAWAAVSNTPVASHAVHGALATTAFARTPSMPSYLVVLAAGDIASIGGVGPNGVRQNVWAVRGDEKDGTYTLESAYKILSYFDEYFGVKYPLAKLDHIAIPGGFGGAMENWGGITYNSPIIIQPARSTLASKQTGFSIVAHEMAHQWNGDLVTMAWWDDIWLNESFASWMAAKTTDRFNPEWNWWQREDATKESAMNADARLAAHAVQQHVVDELQADASFDPEITYDKGQAFLRMLEAYLGESTFRSGIRTYMQTHKYSNATTADLWNALGAAGKKDVAALAKAWTEQPGFPLVTVTASCDASGNRTVSLAQQRFLLDANDGSSRTLWNVPVGLASGVNGTPSFVLLTAAQRAGIAAGRCGEPLRANAGNVGYYRVAYDAPTFDTNRRAFGTLPENDKIGMLDDQWSLARTGQSRIAAYLSLVNAMGGDRNGRAWEQIVASLNALERGARNAPQHDAVAAYARAVVAPLAASLGWDAKPGESVEAGSLRRTALKALGDYGDAATIAEARRRFDAAVDETSTMTSDMRQVVVFIVATNADAATFDRVRTLAQSTKDPQSASAYRLALMTVRDDALAQRALEFALSKAIPPQDEGRRAGLVYAVAGWHPQLAWTFFQAHSAELTKRSSLFEKMLGLSHTIPAVFADAAPPDQLEAWLKSNLPAGAAPYIARAMQRSRTDTSIRARLAIDMKAFIESGAVKTTGAAGTSAAPTLR